MEVTAYDINNMTVDLATTLLVQVINFIGFTRSNIRR
jgi:hypothetical protein